MSTPRKPASVSLPPVRVEPRLYEAIEAIAHAEGRSLSDVVRTLLREVLAAKEQG